MASLFFSVIFFWSGISLGIDELSNSEMISCYSAISNFVPLPAPRSPNGKSGGLVFIPYSVQTDLKGSPAGMDDRWYVLSENGYFSFSVDDLLDRNKQKNKKAYESYIAGQSPLFFHFPMGTTKGAKLDIKMERLSLKPANHIRIFDLDPSGTMCLDTNCTKISVSPAPVFTNSEVAKEILKDIRSRLAVAQSENPDFSSPACSKIVAEIESAPLDESKPKRVDSKPELKKSSGTSRFRNKKSSKKTAQ